MLEKQYFIPEPEEFIAESPMTETLKAIKKTRDSEIRDVIAGRSEKMLVVVLFMIWIRRRLLILRR